MAAPIGGLSNAKWRDDLAVQEINAEHADKRLANVLAEQEKKNKQSNELLFTSIPEWRIGWSCGIVGIWGNYSGKLEARIRPLPYIWRFLIVPNALGGAAKTHKRTEGPQLYQDHYDTHSTRSSSTTVEDENRLAVAPKSR